MDALTAQPHVPIQQTHGVLVVPLQVDLVDSILDRLQADLLQTLHTVQPRGVVLEMSGMPLFDAQEFEALRRMISMIRLMGRDTVLVGIQPGMAAALAESNVDCHGLLVARTLEDALAILLQATTGRPQ
jgi:anti-anti-sigma regulatory factor